MDTTHTASTMYMLWYYIVVNFTNPAVVESIPWPLTAQPIFIVLYVPLAYRLDVIVLTCDVLSVLPSQPRFILRGVSSSLANHGFTSGSSSSCLSFLLVSVLPVAFSPSPRPGKPSWILCKDSS